MPELEIPELMIIGIFGVLVAAVVAGLGWMLFRPKRPQPGRRSPKNVA